jgi:hypothetical protein
MDTKKNIAYGVVIAVVALGIGFYGGTAYAASKTPARGAFAAGAAGGFAGSAARGGMRPGGAGVASGTVLSEDASSITVKLANGSDEIILTSPSTTVAKSTAGSLSDVVVGSSVLVTGTPNSDGSLTASSIQLRPMVSSGQ